MADSIRIKAKAAGAETEVKALITHPMETGQRKDKKTGELIPAHFIQELVAKLNGKEVLSAHWGAAISKNPYVSFVITGAKVGDSIEMSWLDNKGEKDSATAKVE
ncbi:MAG: thiosulfate oxidation carrier complex protein SoxZ [Gammaproteobacteria bacterium]|nr:thiosulfate oxidation carrier complex protein SoxZ [Gammaproteobacteria bacterium]